MTSTNLARSTLVLASLQRPGRNLRQSRSRNRRRPSQAASSFDQGALVVPLANSLLGPLPLHVLYRKAFPVKRHSHDPCLNQEPRQLRQLSLQLNQGSLSQLSMAQDTHGTYPVAELHLPHLPLHPLLQRRRRTHTKRFTSSTAKASTSSPCRRTKLSR